MALLILMHSVVEQLRARSSTVLHMHQLRRTKTLVPHQTLNPSQVAYQMEPITEGCLKPVFTTIHIKIESSQNRRLPALFRPLLPPKGHFMEDTADVSPGDDVLIIDVESMPKIYRIKSIREVLESRALAFGPDCFEEFRLLTLSKCFDWLAEEPEHRIYFWVAHIASSSGDRRSFMQKYYTTVIKPIYEANPTQCVATLKRAVRRHNRALTDPNWEIDQEPFIPSILDKRQYLEACVIFRYWFDKEPFSLLGVSMEAIESVEERCGSTTNEELANGISELE